MRNVFLAFTLTAIVACGSTSPADFNVVGTYKLKAINGSSLPYVVVDNATVKLEFLDDAITLKENGTYAQIGHSRRTEGGKVIIETIPDSGTYTRTGNDIVFRRAADNTADYGTVLENSLTVAHFGLTAAYAKQ